MERFPGAQTVIGDFFTMARQDILMNAPLGEVETTDNIAGKNFCIFTSLGNLLEGGDDSTFYGEIALAPTFVARCQNGDEIRVRIPYIADGRELKVRLRTDNGMAIPEYRLNPQTNRPWYSVVTAEGDSLSPVKVSELWRYNRNGNFNLVLQNGFLILYSGDETDLMMRSSLKQNEVFLLKAFAGNLYQHPTTGVGLIEFLHGNFENSGLAAKLKSEFQNDKMIIHNAYMDSVSGELHLEVTEKDG